MYRNHPKVSDRILDKMFDKMTETSSRPNTCWVASAIPCGQQTARVIVASTEPFTVSEAISTIQATMQGAITPFAPTFTQLQSEAHPNLLFASVHCYKGSHKIRPADEANMAKCQAITASTYLDVELGNVWERTEIGGKQYLIRANEDDLDEVMNIAMTASVAPQARMDGNGFVVYPRAGDFITFFAAEKLEDGGIRPFMDIAQVTEVNANAVGILIEEGAHSASAYLPASSVVNVIEMDAADMALDPDHKLSRASIIEYLKQAYGPEYAAALNTIK